MDAAAAALVPPVTRRRIGHRLTCTRCDVAWTGSEASTCWFCDGPGLSGPRATIYPQASEG